MRAPWSWIRERLNGLPWLEAIIQEHGPSARRVPAVVRRRAVHQRDIIGLPGVDSWLLGPRELVKPVRPRRVGGQLTLSPWAFRETSLPEPFVAELSRAVLVGPHAVPFTREGRMLLTSFHDSLAWVGSEPHPELEAWVAGQQPPEPLSNELCSAIRARPVLSLVNRADENYFHWLVDICGQLEGLRAYAELTGQSASVLVRAGARPFVRESLALLGFDGDSVLEWPMRWTPDHTPDASDLRVAEVPKLVVASRRGYAHGSSARSLRWLRDAFLTAASPGGEGSAVQDPLSEQLSSQSSGSKIYLRRPPEAWRSIQNEREVREFLEAHGYVAFTPEGTSLRDQIIRFSQASSIVSLHGAGLANILFAPRASIIELAGTYGGSEYVSMAGGLGNPYTRVQCEARGDDVRVDLTVLKSVLSDS